MVNDRFLGLGVVTVMLSFGVEFFVNFSFLGRLFLFCEGSGWDLYISYVL